MAKKNGAVDTAVRDELLGLLRGGFRGVRAWNARRADSKRVGSFAGVDLSGEKLRKAELGHRDWSGANFQKAILCEARFFGADLRKANFAGADLRKAVFGDAPKLAGTSFEGADLREAWFVGARLAGANFEDADLCKANFKGARLKGANLRGAMLEDVRWDDAEYDETTVLPDDFSVPRALRWAGKGPSPAARKIAHATPTEVLDVDGFMVKLRSVADAGKLDKALDMLRSDRFGLFSTVTEQGMIGVVKSQSDAERVYSCQLTNEGEYCCCTQKLNACGGLRGSLCKHLLLLIVGLIQSGHLDPSATFQWVEGSTRTRPRLDRDLMGQNLLRYLGAEAGEIDWRPVETVPEDFYGL